MREDGNYTCKCSEGCDGGAIDCRVEEIENDKNDDSDPKPHVLLVKVTGPHAEQIPDSSCSYCKKNRVPAIVFKMGNCQKSDGNERNGVECDIEVFHRCVSYCITTRVSNRGNLPYTTACMTLLLLLTFIIQEPISSGVLLMHAYQSGYNPWIIHLLFIAGTLIDIVLGYWIGSYIHKRFSDKRLVKYLRVQLEKLLAFIGKRGKIVGLILFAPMIFPISALFIPWVGISLGEAMVYLLIGETIIWYGSEWLLVLTTKAFVSDSHVALYAISGALIVVSIFVKMIIVRVRTVKKGMTPK